MSTASNQTCFMEKASESSPPLIQNGKIVIQAHHIGWAVTGLFAIISSVVSFWLVNKHLRWYTKKNEQRHIVRILFMVPIYSWVSFASYLFWNQSTPILLVRDCYESTVLTSFFYLILNYISPDPHEQRLVFLKEGLSKENDRLALRKAQAVKRWMFPLGSVKSKPRDGLYFLQIMKWGILQYCVIRPVTTLIAVILDQFGLYCVDSWSPGWAHLYITVIISISVSIAMYCLLQLYFPISERISSHRPMLKLISIKSVVFLTFWQATFLSLLSFFGIVKDTTYMTADDINIGIGAILETVEMTFFAFLHLKAFSYKPYCIGSVLPQEGRISRVRALGHAFDFRETFRELWAGCVYIFRRWRGIETDSNARRLHVREEVFAKWRDGSGRRSNHHQTDTEKDYLVATSYSPVAKDIEERGGSLVTVSVNVEEQVHVNSERQWLGTGDDYIYGLGFARRERSAGLADQIDEELTHRGFRDSILRTPDKQTKEAMAPVHRKQRSWWQNVIRRLSRASQDDAWERQALTLEQNLFVAEDNDAKNPVFVSHAEKNTNFPICTPVEGEKSPSPRQDPVLGRLFASPLVAAKSGATSEASTPSSRTHPTSHGHHVRLISPAPVVPLQDWRASVRKPQRSIPAVIDDGGTEHDNRQTVPTSNPLDQRSDGQVKFLIDSPSQEESNEPQVIYIRRSHRRERAEYSRLEAESKKARPERSAVARRYRVKPRMPSPLEPIIATGRAAGANEYPNVGSIGSESRGRTERTFSNGFVPFDPTGDLTRTLPRDSPYAYAASHSSSIAASSSAGVNHVDFTASDEKKRLGSRTL